MSNHKKAGLALYLLGVVNIESRSGEAGPSIAEEVGVQKERRLLFFFPIYFVEV